MGTDGVCVCVCLRIWRVFWHPGCSVVVVVVGTAEKCVTNNRVCVFAVICVSDSLTHFL